MGYSFLSFRSFRGASVVSALLILMTLLMASPLAHGADSEAVSVEEDSGESHEAPESFSDYLDSLSSSTIRNAYLLLTLRQYLARAESNYESLEERAGDTLIEIEQNQYTIDSLEGQIDHLSDLIEETEVKIHNVEVQIAEKELEIEETLEAITFNQLEIEDQKRALESYFRLIYFQKNLYYDTSNEANSIKILLEEGTVSEVLQNGTYLSILEQESQALLDGLKDLERTVKRDNYNLTIKLNQLESLRTELEGEQRNLDAQLEGKELLLAESERSDEVYRELFASYKLAQEAILEEINLFTENVELLEERLQTSTASMSPEDLALIHQINADANAQFLLKEAADFIRPDWPVDLHYGPSAYFDDESYAAYFGVAHHAVDIPAHQGSLLYAPADGMIYKVYDPSTLDDPIARLGYGYIVLAFEKGVMMVLGHIEKSLVSEGQVVSRGDIVGLSGGTPGTPGAGGRTTGAHVHIEVLLHGVRVDPLEFLPISALPEDSWADLPEQYLPLLEEELSMQLSEEIDADHLEQAVELFEDGIQETLEESIYFENFFEEEDFWSQGGDDAEGHSH